MTETVSTDVMADLLSSSSSLSQTIKAVSQIEKECILDHAASIGISSNITIELLDVYLRKHALKNGFRLYVHQGNYNDAVGDAEEFLRNGVENFFHLPFFDNLLPSFEAQLGHLSPEIITAKEAELRSYYRLLFEKAKGFRNLFLCSFHRFSRTVDAVPDIIDEVISRFNQVLREEAENIHNIRLINMDDILCAVGSGAAYDHRFYYRGKAPYTPKFLDILAKRLVSVSRAFGGYYYKALVVDCDNTLWGGVIGEDLLNGIKLDPYDYPGNIFWRVQNELVSLEKNGILLCLCSKNNPQDVDEVMESHPFSVIKNQHIVLKMINWNDKAANLRHIAKELNIGLDSLVFLDDSAFECSSVRSQLPAVRTFQVPAALSEFPQMIQEIKELFLAGGVTDDSRSKTQQYRTVSEAENARSQFQTNEEYLASLQLKVELSMDSVASVERISELSFKSSQFNLTTRRYTAGEVRQFMEKPDSTVYSLVVSDKFGNAGLTGVVIMRWQDKIAFVDSFFMSCRVIGRGVETSIWPIIMSHAAAAGCTHISAEYLPTAKNIQTAEFFDQLGLSLVEEEVAAKRYVAPLDTISIKKCSWIEVITC